MKLSSQANLYLIFITTIWGLTFPLIRNAMAYINPFLFVCIRFGLAALILLPLVLRQLSQTHRALLFGALALGVLNSAGLSVPNNRLGDHPFRAVGFHYGI